MDKLIQKAGTLMEALPYLQKYNGKVFAFKYGGHAMHDEKLRHSFLRDIILLKQVGIHPVIVHGGGPQIENVLKKMGIESKYHNGLRITDTETMKVVKMVLVGEVNGELVSSINQLGGNAVGFAGSDGKMILAEKLPLQDDEEGNATIDLGHVGKVSKVFPKMLNKLIYEDLYIPVISPIGISKDGMSLNINADTAACKVAAALNADKLFFLTDVHGVHDKEGQVIAELKKEKIDDMIADGVIKGGMIPKIQSAKSAIDEGVGSVVVLDGQIQHAALLEIFTDKGVGTLIK
jgi:acetylglutamate kinase